MNNRIARLLIGALLSFSVIGISAFAQEGEAVQKEKARREQELRERNAQTQTGTGQTAGNQQQTSGADKAAPPATPKKGKTAKQNPNGKPQTDPPKPQLH
jgi:hypothetical protein